MFYSFYRNLFRLGYLQLLHHRRLMFLGTRWLHIKNCFYNKSSFIYPVIMKIDTPVFKSIFTNDLLTLLNLFRKYNFEIRIAGGAVRDILLGKTPKDIDFATTATPDEMKEMFTTEEVRLINAKGEKHGTITARIGNENFEITTLRIDVVTDGRRAQVLFTKNWELDANRRDLTINSMFLGLDGTVYDYFEGYKDLQKRRIAFVGDARRRVQEDYLRILRYFRFYGRISDSPNTHDDDTLAAISENIDGLGKITGERIWLELSKILAGSYVDDVVERLVQVGAGPYIGFPSEPNIQELRRVWERSKSLNLHYVTILSTLMHTEQDMLLFHARCKLSTFERDLGLFIINHRNDEMTALSLKRYKTILIQTDKLLDTRFYIIELFKYRFEIQKINEFESWDPPKFPLNGTILKQNGVPHGKILGRILKTLKTIWAEDDFKTTQEELLAKLPEIMTENKSKRHHP